MPFFARNLMRAIYATLRVRVKNPEVLEAARAAEKPIIGAFLHGRQFVLPLFFRRKKRKKWVLMTSISRDGELQTRILTGLGYGVVRGSSRGRGSEAFVELVRELEAGADTALAIDGPRGPYGKVQPGVLELARRTGGTVVPVTFGASRARVFEKAWDRYLLPKAFSRVVVVFGRAFGVPRETDEEELERLGLALGEDLARIAREADESFTPSPAEAAPDRKGGTGTS